MSFWSTRRKKKIKPLTPEDLPDFDEDFLALLQQLMPQDLQGAVASGWPVYRKGGSARHWCTSGDNNYIPTGFSQIGVYRWGSVTNPSSHARESVSLPLRYSGDPLAWATILSTTPDYIPARVVCGTDVDNIWIEWWTDSDVTAIVIAYMTMGPGAPAS